MIYRILLPALFFCCAMNAFAQEKVSRVNIIFDSDMGPDYDDVGAITILHALADKGEANILATMASTNYEGVAGVLNLFNTYFNRPGIPVGLPKGDALNLRDWQHWTDTLLARYPHKIKTNAQAADAVKLYRKILALQPNHSVTIVTVGFLTNLSNLLNTGGDAYSALSGRELIEKKVKLLVTMGGEFPSGSEFNIMKDAAASKNVFEHLNIPVIFSGGEIGRNIKSGLPLIRNQDIKNSPVKDAFRIAIPKAAEDSLGRSSWDETAVLVAIKGYAPYYNLHKGKIIIAINGSNTWNDKEAGQGYLIEKGEREKVQNMINRLIRHQPFSRIINRRSGSQLRRNQSTKNRIAKIEALGKLIR